MTFSFVPCASKWVGHGGVGLYVKHGKTGTNTIEVIEDTPNYAWIKTPDRELVLILDAHAHQNTRPLDCNFDEYVSVNPYTPNGMRDYGEVDYVMTNYHEMQGKVAPRHRRPRCEGVHKGKPLKNRTTFLSDSGGFQILVGKVEFLDPAKIAQWYNENTDWGIILDIPGLGGEKELLMESAKIQKRNSNIMFDNKAEHLDLINVIHGASAEGYKKFHDVVDDERFKRLCIANAYSGNIVHSIGDVLEAIMSLREYDHYHLLGIYNLSVIPVYAWFANQKVFGDRLLTADASTHIQSALGKMYHIHRSPPQPAERMLIGFESGVKYPNVHRLLPCSCPVCSTVKYADILGMLNGGISLYLLMYHNMYEICRYMAALDQYAKTMPFEDYKEMIKRQLRNHQGLKLTMVAFDYMEDLLARGPQKARSKFAYYFYESRIFQQQYQKAAIRNLLTIGEGVDEAELDRAKSLYDHDQFIKRMTHVVNLYKQYHGDPKAKEFEALHGKKRKQTKRRKIGNDGARFNKGSGARGAKAMKANQAKQARKAKKDKAKAKLAEQSKAKATPQGAVKVRSAA